METNEMRIAKSEANSVRLEGESQKPGSGNEFKRRLGQPDFGLRLPGNQALLYLEGDAHQMLVAPREPLAAFLAPAKLSNETTGFKATVVTYDIDPVRFPNVRPLDYISQACLDAFEQAAKAFYDKIATANNYEARLRTSFKLPDPQKEPGAYLIYGDGFDRKLLVLWGVECERGSSLPLMVHEEADTTSPTVVDFLRTKLLGWQQMQADVIQMLARTGEPLSRHIGLRSADEKGRVKVKLLGAKSPKSQPGTTSPVRVLMPHQTKAFREACEDFYTRATQAESEYERQIRTLFKLPTATPKKEDLRILGSNPTGSLVVLYGDDRPEKQTSPLTPFADLGIPSPALEESDAELGLTLTEQLQSLTWTWTRIILTSVMAVGTPLAILWTLWILLDRTPPSLIEMVREDAQPTRISFRASKPIDPASIPSKPELLSATFVITDSQGERLPIVSATVVGQQASSGREIVITLGTNLVDEARYGLTYVNLVDRTIMRNVVRTPKNLPFQFRDTTPPKIEAISSDGTDPKRLLILFSRPVNPSSVSQPGHLVIDDNQLLLASPPELDIDGQTAILTVSTPMVLHSDHKLTVKGITDTSRVPHTIKSEVIPFRYEDTLPPKLISAEAKGWPNKVKLTFNEPTFASVMTNLDNYRISHENGNLKIEGVSSENQGRVIELNTHLMASRANYQVEIRDATDVAGNKVTNRLASAFQFQGDPPAGGPKIVQLGWRGGQQNRLLVDFGTENPLDITNNLVRKDFARIFSVKSLTARGASIGVTGVDNVVPTGAFPEGIRSLELQLAQALSEGYTYEVAMTNTVDIWKRKNPRSPLKITPKGSSTRLAVNSAKFHEPNNRKLIRLITNVDIDPQSLVKENFKVEGVELEKVQYASGKKNILLLFLKGEADVGFKGSCSNIYENGRSQPEQIDFSQDSTK